jgi:hypothetical protein
VRLPLLAIIAYLAASQSCSWLLTSLFDNLAAINLAHINLAVLLIGLAVLSIDLVVLCCIDLAVLYIQSHCGAAFDGHSCSSSCWSVLLLAAHESCCQYVLYP